MSSRSYVLKGDEREQAGKGVARALRRENKVPGVIYGDGKKPVSVTLHSKEVNLEYRKGHMYTSLCDLEIGKEKHLVLARDVQVHPVTDNVWHIDFLRVTPKTKLHVHIPVKFIGHEDCPGLRDNGVLNIVKHEIEMICVATEIPDHIDVDLSGLNIDDVVHIQDIKLPAGAKPADSRNFTIVSINEPKRIVEEETAAPAAEGEEGAEGAAAEGAAEADGGDAKKAEEGGKKEK